MNNEFTQPTGSTAKKVNKQSIARTFSVGESDVAYLSVRTVIDTFTLLYDATTQSVWYRGTATGTPVSWSISGNVLTLISSTGTHQLKLAGWKTELLSSDSDKGAGMIKTDISLNYPNDTVGKKLNLLLSPWDFGAIADGTNHTLAEKFATLAEAQVVYPFVTSLTQSIDYAAMQKCVNTMVSRGAAGMTMGGRGQFYLSDTVLVNKTGSVNVANKSMDFSGSQIISGGGKTILNDSSFGTWFLSNGVSIIDSALVFAGNTSAAASATVNLTGLTIGTLYAVSLETESYTSAGYLRIRIDGAAISNSGEYGPGVRYAQFTATATTHVLSLIDDTYTTTPVAAKVNNIDVREAFYPLRFYQGGTAITHGSLTVNNLRITNANSAGFGAIRCEDLNHARFAGVTGIDGFYGPAVHMLNLVAWSENNTFEEIKSANNREAIRFNRVYANGATSGLNSFARTGIERIIIAGNRYAFVCGSGCSVYDSYIQNISGNLTANFRAIFCLHGDQTDTFADSIRVEDNASPATSGIFEYGRNDLRRLALGNVGTYTGVELLAVGSLAEGTVTMENQISATDFRPSVPRFNTISFGEKSGTLGTGLTYSRGTYMWSELLLNCVPGTAYSIGISRNLSPFHGIIEIDAALRLEDGLSYQGTKLTTKLLKGTVSTADASKVVAYNFSHVVYAESLAVTWPASVAPAITLTAAQNRSIQIFARWTA